MDIEQDVTGNEPILTIDYPDEDENEAPFIVPGSLGSNRDEYGRFKPGVSGNPKGRPASGKTMKEFAREWFLQLDEAAKIAYIMQIEEKRPGFAWVMSEGQASEDKTITVRTPVPILGGATQAITTGMVLEAGEDTNGVVDNGVDTTSNSDTPHE